MDFETRDATIDDVPSILSIYNEVVANSTAIYSDDPNTLQQQVDWFAAKRRGGFPVLVAVGDSQVIGFASFADFRGAWPGYRYSVEHGVHVRADMRRQGIGKALVAALLPQAQRLGKHVIIGGIDAANTASIRLHEGLGFIEVARFHEVGRKFDRWLDLVFMQRFIDTPK
jgi:L-amino acid N-acyltransferase YncA